MTITEDATIDNSCLNQGQKSFRGTCAETEDATCWKSPDGCLRSCVSEALALDQRMQHGLKFLDVQKLCPFQRHLRWIRGCNLSSKGGIKSNSSVSEALGNCCIKEIPLSILRDAQYMLLPKLPNLALTRGLHPLPNRYFSRQPQMSGRRQSF